MIIRLHIERVVIEGLPLNGAQTGVLRAALERELSRRFAEGTLDPKHLSGSHAILRGGTVAVDGVAPARFGERIAASVHDSVRTQGSGARR